MTNPDTRAERRQRELALATVLRDGVIARGFDRFPTIDKSDTVSEDAEWAPTAEEVAFDLRFNGLFVRASMVVIDELFGDIRALNASSAVSIEDTLQLSKLPSHFRRQYTPLFAQKFLVAAASVSTTFMNGWEPLATRAEELALKLILDEVRALSELMNIKLESHWRATWEELLYEDFDFKWLYEGRMAGLVGPTVEPAHWFQPFRDEYLPAPYAWTPLPI